jgi:hypothetical protein
MEIAWLFPEMTLKKEKRMYTFILFEQYKDVLSNKKTKTARKCHLA